VRMSRGTKEAGREREGRVETSEWVQGRERGDGRSVTSVCELFNQGEEAGRAAGEGSNQLASSSSTSTSPRHQLLFLSPIHRFLLIGPVNRLSSSQHAPSPSLSSSPSLFPPFSSSLSSLSADVLPPRLSFLVANFVVSTVHSLSA
jgi:hypothetical protein